MKTNVNFNDKCACLNNNSEKIYKHIPNSSPENQIQPTPLEYVKCKQTIFVIKDQNIFIELIMMG